MNNRFLHVIAAALMVTVGLTLLSLLPRPPGASTANLAQGSSVSSDARATYAQRAHLHVLIIGDSIAAAPTPTTSTGLGLSNLTEIQLRATGLLPGLNVAATTWSQLAMPGQAVPILFMVANVCLTTEFNLPDCQKFKFDLAQGILTAAREAADVFIVAIAVIAGTNNVFLPEWDPRDHAQNLKRLHLGARTLVLRTARHQFRGCLRVIHLAQGQIPLWYFEPPAQQAFDAPWRPFCEMPHLNGFLCAAPCAILHAGKKSSAQFASLRALSSIYREAISSHSFTNVAHGPECMHGRVLVYAAPWISMAPLGSDIFGNQSHFGDGLWLLRNAKYRTLWQDCMHPSIEGLQRIAGLFAHAILSVVQRERDQWALDPKCALAEERRLPPDSAHKSPRLEC
jgi:hypothetical protein